MMTMLHNLSLMDLTSETFKPSGSRFLTLKKPIHDYQQKPHYEN